MTSKDVRSAQPTRRNVLIFGGLAIGALGLGGYTLLNNQGQPVQANWDPALGNLKIGYLPITDAAPLLYAHGAGLFEEQGIPTNDPALFRSWPALVEAFQAGALDVVHLLAPLAIQLRFDKGLGIKALAWNHTNGSAITVSKDIQSVDQLEGKVLAIPGWYSIHNVILQKLLRANSLEPVISGEAGPGQVKLVVVAPADMPTALVAGEISGYTVADPFNAVAEVQDIGRILRFTGDIWKDHACCITVVREDLVVNHPEAAQAIINGLLQSQLAIRADGGEAARLLSEGGYLPQPLPAIEKALTDYDHDHYGDAIQHPEWESRRIDFQPHPYPSYTPALVEALRETVIDGETAFLDAIDLSTVHEELFATAEIAAGIDENGGLSAFGIESESREEIVNP
jgi:NitT/TauT family transport system substrate-binding protein